MHAFHYRGVTQDGEEVTGSIEAGDKSAALQQLLARNIRAYDMKIKRPGSGDYLRMLEQLGVLIEAEISITEAVQSLTESVEHRKIADELAKTLTGLRRGERLGMALGTAMPSLPPLVTNMIRLGEATGDLAKALKLTVNQLSLQEQTRNNISNALIYPGFLAVVGVIVVGFLLFAVVPRFAGMLEEHVNALPPASRLVFDISAFLIANWPIMLAGAGGLTLVAAGALRLESVRAAALGAAFKAPLTGPLLRQSELANWTRTVGIAFGSGANLLDAVTLAQGCVRNNAARFDEIARSLRAGAGLDEALAKTPDMDKMVVNLVATGIKAGRMADMLMLATSILDRKTKDAAARISKLAEPAAILAIASITGLIVIAMVTAMTSMYDFAAPL